MGIKFSSIMFMLFALFIVKISLENFGDAKASTQKAKIQFEKPDIKVSKK